MNSRPRFVFACVVPILVIVTAFATGVSLAHETGEPEVASSISEIRNSLKREPENAKLYVRLGQAYWSSGDYQNAFEALKQAIRLAPGSAEAHNWMGAFLMGRGNLPDAISELRKAVSLDPRYARAQTNLGSALAKSGDIAGALGAFQNMVLCLLPIQ